jgi:DNA-binding MarR family transcriptional regulator
MSSDQYSKNDVAPPAIGGLLRMAWQIHRDRMYERITANGFANVTRAQFELLRWPSIDGLRPGEIAQLSGLSKQAVNDLLGELERTGYIERHHHPADRRARLVRLTAAGKELQHTAHETSRALEAGWAASVGAERLVALRSTLEDMVARGLPRERQAE